MVSYAGAEAVRQLIPTHPNPDSGASQDKRDAAEFIRHHIGSDAAAIDLLISLVKRRCALLVEQAGARFGLRDAAEFIDISLRRETPTTAP
jgi:hypothetical protein